MQRSAHKKGGRPPTLEVGEGQPHLAEGAGDLDAEGAGAAPHHHQPAETQSTEVHVSQGLPRQSRGRRRRLRVWLRARPQHRKQWCMPHVLCQPAPQGAALHCMTSTLPTPQQWGPPLPARPRTPSPPRLLVGGSGIGHLLRQGAALEAVQAGRDDGSGGHCGSVAVGASRQTCSQQAVRLGLTIMSTALYDSCCIPVQLRQLLPGRDDSSSLLTSYNAVTQLLTKRSLACQQIVDLALHLQHAAVLGLEALGVAGEPAADLGEAQVALQRGLSMGGSSGVS